MWQRVLTHSHVAGRLQKKKTKTTKSTLVNHKKSSVRWFCWRPTIAGEQINEFTFEKFISHRTNVTKVEKNCQPAKVMIAGISSSKCTRQNQQKTPKKKKNWKITKNLLK